MARITKRAVARVQADERRAIKASGKPAGSPATATMDSYQNFMQAIGYGANNSLSSSTYGFNPITRTPTLLEWIYRGSWFGKILIDVAADDMTRGGIEIQSTIKPEDVEKIQASMTRQGVWGGINEAHKWGELYGGAIGVIMIDGQDPRQPLNIERVGRDTFRGVLPLDRWMLEPDQNDLVTDLGPELGQPKYYKVTSEAPAFRLKAIHHSRCIRFEGVKLPFRQRMMENMWGLSIFEPIYDRMVAIDSATMGMAQLIYKAYIRTIKFKGLRKLLSETKGERALLLQIEMMRRTQGNEGITVLDAEDEFEGVSQTTFTGINDAVLGLIQQVSGYRQIPLVRMLGQAPAGLNATGESDLRTYYDGVKQQQELKLRMGMTKIVHIAAKSEGVKLPEEFTFNFRELWQLSETEKSEVFSRDSTAIGDLEAGGLISPQTALKELRQGSYVTGRMSNISDEDIENASDEAVPPIEEGLDPNDPGLGMQAANENRPGGGPIRSKLSDIEKRKAVGDADKFEEGKHPRGQPENAGQFGKGGGGSSAEGSGDKPDAGGGGEAGGAAAGEGNAKKGGEAGKPTHKQVVKSAQRAIKLIEASKMGNDYDNSVKDDADAAVDEGFGSSEIDQLEKDIASITDEDRAGLKDGEVFNAEQDMEELRNGLADRAQEMGDKVNKFAATAAKAYAKIQGVEHSFDEIEFDDIAPDASKEELAELESIVAELKVGDLDYEIYKAREGLETAASTIEDAAEAVAEITPADRKSLAEDEVFDAEVELEEAQADVEIYMQDLTDALRTASDTSREVLKALAAKIQEINKRHDPGGPEKTAAKKTGDSGGLGEFQGIPIRIETRAGERRWKDGPRLPAAYGFIRGVGSNEGWGEWMDCFLGPDARSGIAYVIDMAKPGSPGKFDEHKVMLGFSAEDQASETFALSYAEGRKMIMAVTPMALDVLKAWLASGDFTKPAAKWRPV